jgi:hypothetical protein
VSVYDVPADSGVEGVNEAVEPLALTEAAIGPAPAESETVLEVRLDASMGLLNVTVIALVTGTPRSPSAGQAPRTIGAVVEMGIAWAAGDSALSALPFAAVTTQV